MAKYFVEFELKTDFENHYWFPLFLNADDLSMMVPFWDI